MRVAALLLAFVLGGWSWIDQPVVAVEDGNRAFARGDFAAAASAYEQALVEGTEPALLYNRGLALYRLGLGKTGAERDEALRRAESALARAGSSEQSWLRARALTGLGNVYSSRGELGEAIAAYRRALIVDPQSLVARHNLELALRRRAEEKADASAQGKGDPDGNAGQKPNGSAAGSQEGNKEQQGEQEAGPEQPVGEDSPDPEHSTADARTPGGSRERSPEQRSGKEISDLDAKLESLERRSRSLRRKLLGKRKSRQVSEAPW
jgi:tetratricopeptide (TPR) repeat protein